MDNSFYKLSETAQYIAETRITDHKIKLCTAYFSSLQSNKNLDLAARFLGEGAFSPVSGKHAALGSRTYSTCAAAFCEIDYEKVFKPCKEALGNAPEAIEKLMSNIEIANRKRSPAELSLTEVEAIYEAIAEVASRADKQYILRTTWKEMTPREIKYFIRIVARGSLRIGLQSGDIIAALARAFNKDVQDLHYVHMITGSMGRTAVLCKNNRLDEASFNLFQPVPFMQASPIENHTVDNFNHYIAEEKLDGMRAQMHISGSHVELYSRDLDNVTHLFPEVAGYFASRTLPDLVLDGQICIYKDETILPVQLLQKRKALSQKMIEKYPALFIPFDLLFYDGTPAFKKPLIERRLMLKTLAKQYHLPVTAQFDVSDRGNVEKLTDRVRAYGSEGLILKKKDSLYEYGQQSRSWLQMKRPGRTLDTVLMYAHGDPGKRSKHYTDFTLGIRVKEDERYEEAFIPIGRMHSNLADAGMEALDSRIKELTVEKYGPTVGLIPGIVIEVTFDAIQVNKRTKANYTLKRPRFKAIRWNLGPDDADMLRDVERMIEARINRKRLKRKGNPSFYFY